MGTVSTTNNNRGESTVSSPELREKRIKKAAPAAIVHPVTEPSAPKEVRKVKVKPEVKVVDTEPAPVVAERRAEGAPATPSDIKVKKSKAELRAEKEARAAKVTPADLQTLENNLVILDEYGPSVLQQLKDYFSQPFAGGEWDPAKMLSTQIIMWTRPWRKKITGTGTEADGKILSFKRFEVSLLGETIHNGVPHTVVYPLEQNVAAAMPSGDWVRTGMDGIVAVIPSDEEMFNKFLLHYEPLLYPEGQKANGERRVVKSND